MTSPRLANTPFDVSDADIVFRTSDGVDFRLYRVILALASPVFKDMLEFPLPPSSDDSLPIVPISESSAVLEPVLLFCYPATTPAIRNLGEARPILDAATKYDITCVINSISLQLTSPRILTDKPIPVYFLACRYGWEEVAKSAAKACLTIRSLGRPSIFTPELELATAAAYHRLLVYHLACGKAAGALGLARTSRGFLWVAELPASCPYCTSNGEYIVRGGGTIFVSRWFLDIITAVSAELAERPDPTTVLQSSQFESPVGKNANCGHCNSYNAFISQGKLKNVKHAYADKVKEEIEKVELEFKY